MTDVIQFLWPPFLVAVCLVGIHTYFGILVLARKVIFVDLALAQIAALGATVAFMLGHSVQSMATYGYSLTFTVLAAVLPNPVEKLTCYSTSREYQFCSRFSKRLSKYLTRYWQ